ncbi:MAG: hypothetical protein AABY22_17010 [Nanoarchaeota archaeon]
MAIVFESPKRKKRVLFWGTSFFIILVLLIIFLAAFPPIILEDQLATVLEDVIIPKIEVNFDIDPFEGITPNTDSIGRNEPFLPY